MEGNANSLLCCTFFIMLVFLGYSQGHSGSSSDSTTWVWGGSADSHAAEGQKTLTAFSGVVNAPKQKPFFLRKREDGFFLPPELYFFSQAPKWCCLCPKISELLMWSNFPFLPTTCPYSTELLVKRPVWVVSRVGSCRWFIIGSWVNLASHPLKQKVLPRGPPMSLL